MAHDNVGCIAVGSPKWKMVTDFLHFDIGIRMILQNNREKLFESVLVKVRAEEASKDGVIGDTQTCLPRYKNIPDTR